VQTAGAVAVSDKIAHPRTFGRAEHGPGDMTADI
jgi:hypothetical protein